MGDCIPESFGLMLKFALLVSCVHAYIYPYKEEPLKRGSLEYRRVGMYAKDDSPAGHGDSYIHLDVEITRDQNAGKYGVVEVLVAHSSAISHIGYTDKKGQRHFCCTGDVVLDNGCSHEQLGTAIVDAVATPKIQVKKVEWFESTVADVNTTFYITHTGRYYLLFSSCLNSTGDATMSGEIVWMNPFGYLPGELYPFIPLFQSLFISYVVLLALWLLLCLLYRSQLMKLQFFVTVVIVLGMMETATWYFDYKKFNESGIRQVTPVVAGVILSSVKKTLSRLLVLVVCMGYGVMTTVLANDQVRKVTALGVVYFVFSSIYDVMSSYSQTTPEMQRARTFFLVPVAALDSIFFLWILQEIQNNIELLSTRQQVSKLTVYNRFWRILVMTASFSVVWVLYQTFEIVHIEEDQRWESLWAFEGAWHIIYFAVLIAIAFLWRPSSHTLAYAFSEQLATDDKFEPTEMRPTPHAIEPAFAADSDEEK